MTERLQIENLYKIFSNQPQPAMDLLARGADKDEVQAETGMVVGLNNVSLTVPTGAMYMIMGLSGSGKSTLARCVNRLNEPTAGRILLDGEDIVALNDHDLREVRRTRISMVFQHFALLPNRTVIENVEFGLKLRGLAVKKRRSRAEDVLSIVGLDRWGYHFPHELSGGMRQRVGLARALATDADVLVMDEAFSALDPLIRTEMQDELLRLQRSLKKTILFITHDFQEALKLGNVIAIMADGKVMREGTPQSIVSEPGSDYVAAFTNDVDRSRLFDAASVMQAGTPVASAGRVKVVAGEGTGGFALNDEGRVVGRIDAASLDRARSGGNIDAEAQSDFLSVRRDSKLLDVARMCRGTQDLAVTDEDGRFVGIVSPSKVLAAISATSQAGSKRPTEEKLHA